jgi:SAM-dependent methyltransferase
MFRLMYRLGLTPWDGHPIAPSLRRLVEGADNSPLLSPGRALDVGCGTGDTSIYLAQHGWQVTGVDFVPRALNKARAKGEAVGVAADFRHADATRLTSENIGSGFGLIVDNGCLHGMSNDDRVRYAREVTAVADRDAWLLLVEFLPDASFAVPGIDQEEIDTLFRFDWVLASTGDDTATTKRYRKSLRHYLLERRKR